MQTNIKGKVLVIIIKTAFKCAVFNTRKPSWRQVSTRQPCVYEDLFLPSHRCLTPPSWGTHCDINVIYTSLKSAFSGLQFRHWQYRSVFIRLAVIASETREMSREFHLITVQGHRSWCQWKAHMW